MAVQDVSSKTPSLDGHTQQNNYTTWLRALVCAYLPVRVPVRCGGPVLPTAALVPSISGASRAHTDLPLLGLACAANAVPSCLSPWTPCDNTVATKD